MVGCVARSPPRHRSADGVLMPALGRVLGVHQLRSRYSQPTDFAPALPRPRHAAASLPRVATSCSSRASSACEPVDRLSVYAHLFDRAQDADRTTDVPRRSDGSDSVTRVRNQDEAALPEEASVPASRGAAVAGPDVPAVRPRRQPLLPTQERPARPKLETRPRRPRAQHLHPPAIQLDVVVRRAGGRSPAEERRRRNAGAGRRREQRRGALHRPSLRRDCPAVRCGGRIDVAGSIDGSHLEPMGAPSQP